MLAHAVYDILGSSHLVFLCGTDIGCSYYSTRMFHALCAYSCSSNGSSDAFHLLSLESDFGRTFLQLAGEMGHPGLFRLQ